MKSSEFARIFGGVIVLLVILFGCLAFIQTLRNSPIWGDTGAAWVQAIGSIAAILGAIWISREETRRDQRKDEINETRSELATARILISLLTVADNLASEIVFASSNFDRRRLEGVSEGLDALRPSINDVLARALSDETIEAALNIQWHIEMGAGQIRRALAQGGATDYAQCEVSFRFMQSQNSLHYPTLEALMDGLGKTLVRLRAS